MRAVTYHQLDGSLQAAARQRVCGILDRMARESGRICVEASSEIARRAKFEVTTHGGIWGIVLPGDMRILR